MSPRYVPPSPKGPKPPAYLERFLKTFDKVGPPYRLSWRDEYEFLFRQWQRDRAAERNDPMAWFDGPTPVLLVRPDREGAVLRENVEPDTAPGPVIEPELVAEPAQEEAPPAPAKRKSRFQTLEL